MRAVVQRVLRASVATHDQIIGEIGKGYVVLIGVEAQDTQKDVDYIVDKVKNLRVFEDEQEKMNLSLSDVNGGILAVSQFTLLGDVRGGRRPSFIAAEKPQRADELYNNVVSQWREAGFNVQTGMFGADMVVTIINDGPVTIMIDSRKTF